MKKSLTLSLSILLFLAAPVGAIKPAQFAKSNQTAVFIKRHQNIQKKLAKIEDKITISKNLLSSDDSNLAELMKDLKKINQRHKRIYKRLIRKFSISKNSLSLIKDHQSLMSLKRSDKDLRNELQESFKLAGLNNAHLKSIIEDNKALAFTNSPNSGLYGKVTMLTGNCMPQVNSKESTCTESSFPTTVVIRELVTAKDLDRFLYYKGDREPLYNLNTNDEGVYKLDLPVGKYSVFVLDENNKEYCNSYDGEGYACKIEILDQLKSEFNVVLDRAAY